MDALPYGLELAVGLLRVGGVAAVLFVVLTRLTLPGPPAGSAWEGRGWGDSVLGVSATVVAASALGVLGLFDVLSLVTALALALAVGAVLRYRRVWRRTLLLRYADGLRGLERLVPPSPVAPGVEGSSRPRASFRAFLRRLDRRESRPQRGRTTGTPWKVALGLTSAAAIAIRLIPVLAEPAPFTLRYYASLETVKGLMVGAPTGSEGGWGLPALVLALAEMARVDPALVLRGAGALAAGAVTVGVFKTVRSFWSEPAGALAGALFVAVGGPLQAVPLNNQAGAEPLLLAAALALSVFPHLSTYVGDGNRRGVTVGLVGLAATGLVYPAVGALLAAVVGLQVLAIVVQVQIRRALGAGRRGRYRDRSLPRRAGVLALGGTLIAVGWRGYTALLDRLGAEGTVFFFESAQASTVWPSAVALATGGLLLVAPVVPGRTPFAAGLPRPGALVRNGLQTVGLLVLWDALGGGLDGLAGGAAVLLTCSAAITVGLLANEVHVRWVRPLWSRAGRAGEWPTWAPSAVAVAAVVAVVWTGWGVPVPGVPVEPAGFVVAAQDIADGSAPYTWTAISHLGTGLRARHRGRFMDYAYFLDTYDPRGYSHVGPDAIPTPDVYFFLERGTGPSLIRDELLPPGRRHSERLRAWLGTYATRDDGAARLSIVYQDDEVEVVRLGRPAGTLLSLPDDLSASGLPAPLGARHTPR